MWHQETLNHELDKINKRVIVCQKLVRGFICRRRLQHLLKHQRDQKLSLLNQIESQGSSVADKMSNLKLDNYKVELLLIFLTFNFRNF